MSVSIIYKEKDEKVFWENWNILFQDHKTDYSYYPENLEMNLILSKERSLFVADKSFVYLVNEKVAGGAHIIIEKSDKYISVTTSGGYLPAPIFSNNKIGKKIFGIIFGIAKKNGVEKIMFNIGPLAKDVQYNYLQKFGFLDTSILSYVVHNLNEDVFLKETRKGHRCDIKKMLNNSDLEVFYMDENNADYNIHIDYCNMHHECAGKVTRSQESFDKQFESLKKGRAVLVGIKYKGASAGFCYFEFNNEKGIYYSGVDNPNIEILPYYHIMMYKAFEYLYRKGVKYIDTGQPSSPTNQFDYSLDNKQNNITLFKRGFPGSFMNCYRGIRYLSRELCEKEFRILLDNYINNSEFN